MDNSIEWLFEEVYKNREKREVNFLSDWNVISNTSISTNFLFNNFEGISKYNYAYEQFELKEQILSVLNDGFCNKEIKINEITISPSATSSIFLMSKALSLLSIKRILVFTPLYFSILKSIVDTGGQVFYYHLLDDNNLNIDINEVNKIIQEQLIDAIVITDPIYSSGKEISIELYESLSLICEENSLYFIADYSLGGLDWNAITHDFFNFKKIEIISRCKKYFFIDTLPKKLMINGVKFSIVIGSIEIIDKIDLISESVYGALNYSQCLLIKNLYKIENKKHIHKICDSNIKDSIEKYNLLKSILINTNFDIADTNSGYFTMINHNKIKLNDIDTKLFALTTLKELNILTLTKDRFSYYKNNKFGIRINLNKKTDELMSAVIQCIGIDYRRFYNRN